MGTVNWQASVSDALEKLKKLYKEKEELASEVNELHRLQQDVNDKNIVMVIGEFKAGKSTFINALLGEEIVISESTPATATVTKITYGEDKKIIGHFHDGTSREFNEKMFEQLTVERTGHLDFLRLNLFFIELQLPNERLKNFTIVDTPGLGTEYEHHTRATEMFIERADFAIWLFRARYMGNAEELKTIKILLELGIPTSGVANAIDEIDPEEEDPDKVLEEQEVRLQNNGFPVKLIGISALDALEGQLEQDEEKMQWSNFAEVEKLFEEFKEDRDTKVERIFTKLREHLRKLDDIVLRESARLDMQKNAEIIESFLLTVYPRFLEKRSQDTQTLLNLKHVYESSFNLFGKEINSVDVFKKELNTFFKFPFYPPKQYINQLSRIGDKWKNSCLPLTEDVLNQLADIQARATECQKQKEHLSQEWRQLRQKKFFKKNAYEAFEQKQTILNTHISKINAEYSQCNSMIEQNIRPLLLELTSDIELVVNLSLEEIKNHISTLYSEAEEEHAAIKEMTSHLSMDFLQSMKKYADWLREVVWATKPLFSNPDTILQESRAFHDCLYLFGNISLLSIELPIDRFIRSYDDFTNTSSLNCLDELYIYKMRDISLFEKPLILPTKLDFPVNQNIQSLMGTGKYTAIAVIVLALIFGTVVGYTQSDKTSTFNEVKEDEIEHIEETELVAETQATTTTEETKPIRQVGSWTKSEVEKYLKNLRSDVESAYKNNHNFQDTDWFDENGWSQYDFSFYQSTYYSIQSNLVVEDIMENKGYEVTVVTEETYENEYETVVYNNRYTLMHLRSGDVVVSGFTTRLLTKQEKAPPINETRLNEFLSDYRNAYFSSLNHTNFSYVSSYLNSEQPAYEELRSYISSLKGKSYSFQDGQFTILNSTVSQAGVYEVRTKETFSLIDAYGVKANYEKEKIYQISIGSEDELRIMSIETIDTIKNLVTQRTIDSVSAEDVSAFMHKYYQDFVDAFNAEGFSYVEKYYAPDGKGFKEDQTYLKSANDKKMLMKNQYITVKNVTEQDANHYLVKIYVEDRYNYQDGTGDFKKIDAEYLVRVTASGQLLIEGIESLQVLEKMNF